MRLNHLHISGIVPFKRVSQVQSALVAQFMDYKKAVDSTSRNKQDTSSTSEPQSQCPPKPPSPTILSFVPEPVYTTGRRDMPPDFKADDTTPPDKLQLPSALEPIRPLLSQTPPRASWYPTLRGGQTTYHGPGQVVIYTIMDLKAMRLGPRTHIRALEQSVMNVATRLGIKTMRTADPGVWVPRNEQDSSRIDATTAASTLVAAAQEGIDSPSKCCPPTPPNARKLAAVGVHLRRFISSYGVGLNVTNQPLWYFSQIVPCGLARKEATSLENEGVEVLAGMESINAKSEKVAIYGENEKKEVYMSAERVIAGMFVSEFVNILNRNFRGHGESSAVDEIDKIETVELKDDSS